MDGALCRLLFTRRGERACVEDTDETEAMAAAAAAVADATRFLAVSMTEGWEVPSLAPIRWGLLTLGALDAPIRA